MCTRKKLESSTVGQIINKVLRLWYCAVISQTGLAMWVVCSNGAARLSAVKAARCEYFSLHILTSVTTSTHVVLTYNSRTWRD